MCIRDSDGAAVIVHEIDLAGGVLGRPVVRNHLACGNELLAHVVFREGPLELGKQLMAVNENRGIETACRAEESHVEQVYLESVSILVGGEGQSRLRDAVDAQKQSCCLLYTSRVEKKYRIDVAERAAVEAAAERLMAVDDYGRTRITSLYLDTPERAMIARSVEKPLYKEKLRLRAYGDAAGVALMGAFGAGPIVREPGGLPLSDGEVETRVAAGLRVARTAAGLQVAPAAAGLQTMGDADGDAVGSVEACRPCAGEALRGNGLSAGSPVFFGIKKKFKGIVYKRRLALTLPAALAFVSGLPYEQACARWPLPDLSLIHI